MKPASAHLAAATGVVFSLLFVSALVLLHRAPRLDAPDAAYSAFYAHDGDGLIVAVGLYLVPLAGIAFMWFAVAIRSVLDAMEHTPSALAHGLNLLAAALFVTMLFAGTAAVGAPAFGSTIAGAPTVAPDTARALAAVGYGFVFVFAVRGAGMFALTTTTLLRSAGVLGRVASVVAYLFGAYLLLTATYHPASLLVLPAWVLLVAGALVRHARRTRAQPDRPLTAEGTPAEGSPAESAPVEGAPVAADASTDRRPLPDTTPETAR